MSDKPRKMYYIETNKSWFTRFFKRKNKKYSLCKEELIRYHDDSWFYSEKWVKTVLYNSNYLGSLELRLVNLKSTLDR